MVKTCCVRNCDIGPKGNVTCFRFPSNRQLRRQWVEAVGLSSKLCGGAAVCIRHFRARDYHTVRGRPTLKARVVPSVFGDTQALSDSGGEDVILDEINPDVTLESLRKENVLLHNNIGSSNEGSTKSHSNIRTRSQKLNSSVDVENENRTNFQHEGGSTEVSNEGRTELINEDSAKSKKNRSKSQDKTSLEDNEGSQKSGVKFEVSSEQKTGDDESNTIKKLNEKSKSPSTDTRNPDPDKEPQNEGSIKLEEEGREVLENEYKEASNEGSKSDSVNVSSDTTKRENGGVTPNGVMSNKKKGYQDSFIESATGKSSALVAAVEDLSKDIEDIIAHYQIEQTRPVHAPEPPPPEAPPLGPAPLVPVPLRPSTADPCEGFDDGFGKESDPVFIELAVKGAGGSNDCLMVLESVQVELDPRSFPHEPPADTDTDPDTVHLDTDDEEPQRARHFDPISLLTSSDEDEVIIQEPRVDTVLVSDETDEDDVPLVRLRAPSPRPPARAGALRCAECGHTAASEEEYRAHAAQHSTILQVCGVCDYTTASKSQFSRHKRKHKEDRRFKCHLCDYRARHNMSLIYHLKSHRALSSARRGYRCDKCGFRSDVKALVLKHVKLCTSDVKMFRCDRCAYETKRPSDLKRHKARRHGKAKVDDEDFVP